MALIPKNGGALNIAVLSPLSALKETILFQRFLFVWADIGGLFLLGIFFWFFTWRMIQPLAKNRQKQAEFIASASHELRSPLTVMLSSLSAMKQASPEEQEHFSKNIEIEGKRMGRLIEDMLALSSADSSHFSIHKNPVELDTLLLSAYEKFEPLARKKSISISISLPDKIIPPCPCDKERIEQVFSILLDNAISYTPPEGRISLSMEASMEREKRRSLGGSTAATNPIRISPILGWGFALRRKSSICIRGNCGLRIHREAGPLSWWC